MVEAVKESGTPQTSIFYSCTGESRVVKGFIWSNNYPLDLEQTKVEQAIGKYLSSRAPSPIIVYDTEFIPLMIFETPQIAASFLDRNWKALQESIGKARKTQEKYHYINKTTCTEYYIGYAVDATDEDLDILIQKKLKESKELQSI